MDWPTTAEGVALVLLAAWNVGAHIRVGRVKDQQIAMLKAQVDHVTAVTHKGWNDQIVALEQLQKREIDILKRQHDSELESARSEVASARSGGILSGLQSREAQIEAEERRQALAVRQARYAGELAMVQAERMELIERIADAISPRPEDMARAAEATERLSRLERDLMHVQEQLAEAQADVAIAKARAEET